MPESGVKVRGYEELGRGTARLADQLEAAAPHAFEKTAGQAAAVSRARVPHVSGRMAASITTGQTVGGATVGYDGSAPYAGWVEFGGTRNRAYAPGGRYLFPVALDGAEPLLKTAGELHARTQIGGFRWPSPRL